MNKLSDYHILEELLKEKKNELWRLQQEYNSIVQQEPYMRGKLKGRQHTIYKLAGEIKSIEKELKQMEKHTKDAMNMLKLMGWTTDSDCGKVYTKGEAEDECKDGGPGSGIKGHTTEKPSALNKLSQNWTQENINHIMRNPHLYREEVVEEAARKALENKSLLKKAKDDDATEMGSFEQLGQNHETEAMEPSDNPVQAQDGYNFEDPKVIEAAIKKVEASGHPDKDYLAGLKRALELAKKERAQKDSMISEVLNPLKESWSKIKELSTEDEEVGEKFKTVMEEFGKGELKSSSGEKVTDPKQAKAIAYSEQREATKDEKFEIIYSTGKWPNEVKTYKEIFNAPYEEAKKRAESKKKGDYYRLVQVTKVKDSDPKVAEANKLINLFGGAM